MLLPFPSHSCPVGASEVGKWVAGHLIGADRRSGLAWRSHGIPSPAGGRDDDGIRTVGKSVPPADGREGDGIDDDVLECSPLDVGALI